MPPSRKEEMTYRLSEFSRRIALAEQLYFAMGYRYHQIPVSSRPTPDAVDEAFVVFVRGGPVAKVYLSRLGPISPGERIAVPDAIIKFKELNKMRDECKANIDKEDFSKADEELASGAKILMSSIRHLLCLHGTINTAYNRYDRNYDRGSMVETYRKDLLRAWLFALPAHIRHTNLGATGSRDQRIDRAVESVAAVQEPPVDEILQLMGAVQLTDEGTDEEAGQRAHPAEHQS